MIAVNWHLIIFCTHPTTRVQTATTFSTEETVEMNQFIDAQLANRFEVEMKRGIGSKPSE